MKKHINKIIIILLILNILIIGLAIAKSYKKSKKITLDGNNLVNEIEITYDVQANPLSKVEITDLTNTTAPINSCVGAVGQSFNISGNFYNFQLKKAEISLKYDESKLETTKEEDLGILWYDKEKQQMVTIESDIDTDKNTISFTTDHFSEYIIVNINEWETAWHKRVIKVRDESDKFEIAFVIDDSGSMKSNDPQDLRLEATKNFVEILEEKDKYSIIEFEDSANILQELTSEKEKVDEAIAKFESNGGTNIASGLEKGIEILDTNSDSSRVIVLLTDGEDSGLNSKREELIKKAKDKDIIIFTIFLNTGNNTNQNNTVDIEKIAKDTYGEFYTISSEEVIDIFNKIRKVSVGTDATVDTDNDGIPDEIELGGIKNQFGQIVYTNPYTSDTDGDGITDDKEIGSQQTAEDGTAYYPMISDPTRVNETTCEYYTTGANSEKYNVWDSGFKLNRDSFRFVNIDVNRNGGICLGLAHIIEGLYNKNIEIETKETNEVPYERGSHLSVPYDVTGQKLNIIFDKALPYFYYPENDKLLKKSSFYTSATISEFNNNSPDEELIKCLYDYWIKRNNKIMASGYNYWEDKLDEDYLDTLKLLFSNDKIVTMSLYTEKGGHAVNAYALEQRSENEYRLYIYDCNHPYGTGLIKKNCYITLRKTKDNDEYDVIYDSSLKMNTSKNTEEKVNSVFLIEYNGKAIYENFFLNIDGENYEVPGSDIVYNDLITR